MATIGDDCYFFCTSTCAKGPACPFRHVEAAKTCKIVCQHWQMGGCFRPMCKFRHSDFKLSVDYSDVPCFWETQPSGCTKINCAYKHSKPRPQAETAALAITSASGDSPAVSSAPDGSTVTPAMSSSAPAQNFVRPLVKPVIIQPAAESEDSNPSPAKRLPEELQLDSQQHVVKLESDSKQPGNKKENGTEKVRSKVEDKITENAEKEDTEPAADKVVKKKVKKVKANVQKAKVTKKGNVKNVTAKKTVTNTGKKGKANVGVAKKKKAPDQPRKSAKERLGCAVSERQADSKTKVSESGSDSDDSIENIKVMSMEEIFRQKALESMRKKRAAEGKGSTPVKGQAKSTTRPTSVKKTQPVQMPAESSSSSSSSSSEEESSSNEEEVEESSVQQAESTSSSSSSSSDSSDSDEESESEEFEPDVRRVIVDVENEKAARKRAKASLLKKQKVIEGKVKGGKVTKATARIAKKGIHGALNLMDKRAKGLKKRQVDVDYDSDDIVSARVKQPLTLNVRSRLGKPLASVSKEDATLQSRAAKFGLASGLTKRAGFAEKDSPRKAVLKASESEDDEDLAGIKIKTLEEIKQEKMKKLGPLQSQTGSPKSLPVKQRLGMAPVLKEQRDEENRGRQVLLVNESGSKSDDADKSKPTEEQKKAKRRPWRKRNSLTGEDERTAVMKKSTPEVIPTVDGDSKSIESGLDKEDFYEGESIFDRMKRRALMKKLQGGSSKKKLAYVGDADFHNEELVSPSRNIIQAEKLVTETEANKAEKDQAGEDSSGSKKHKHKHKHRHKKSKVERQIYMPPAMKNSVTNLTVKRAVSPENASLRKEPVTAPTAKVAPQKRGSHPIAAAWAAGLSLSAKGTIVRKPEVPDKTVAPPVRLSVASRLGAGDSASKPKATISSLQTSQSAASESSGVSIKSFAEIMAEKRKRRLELQAQKAGSTAASASATSLPAPAQSNSSSLSTVSEPSSFSTSPLQPAESKPRVPISPIVFSSDNSSSGLRKGTSQGTFVSSQKTFPGTSDTSNSQPISSFTPSETKSSTSSTLQSRGTENSPFQRVKLKATNKNGAMPEEKKKKAKKLFKKKKSIEQSDDIGNSEESNLSPLHSYSATSVPSASVISETSQDTLLLPCDSSSQPPTVGSSMDYTDSPFSSSNFSTNSSAIEKKSKAWSQTSSSTSAVTTPSAKLETSVTGTKHALPSSSVDSEPSKKKTRLSMEDEFDFLEEGALEGEVAISGDIEPIDDLLQDIDDLLN